jgi:hypothetical protein
MAPDVRGALGVDRDRVDLATVELLDDVKVTGRGGAGRAAVLGLGLHPEATSAPKAAVRSSIRTYSCRTIRRPLPNPAVT